MIIAGSGGHAKEVFSVLVRIYGAEDLCFFNDLIDKKNELNLFSRPVLCEESEVKPFLERFPLFVLGTGNPDSRRLLRDKLTAYGGELHSVVSKSAVIGENDVSLGAGINVMEGVIIYNNVEIKEGALINTASSIHHDVKIGAYCEICPGARILGNAFVGDYTFIGSNAVVLPGIRLGNNVKIGAGAVVTSDVPDNEVWAGVPARKIK